MKFPDVWNVKRFVSLTIADQVRVFEYPSNHDNTLVAVLCNRKENRFDYL